MTFEEWFSTQRMQSELAWDWAKAAWAAATLAEREACAKKVAALAKEFDRRGLEGASLIADCAKSMRSGKEQS